MTNQELMQLPHSKMIKLIDEGKLVYLPCNLGDEVYWLSYFGSGICQGTVSGILISGFGIDLKITRRASNIITKELEKVYFSREEAEKALKERENNGK